MHRLRKTNLILSLMMLSLVSIGFSSWVFSPPSGEEITFDDKNVFTALVRVF